MKHRIYGAVLLGVVCGVGLLNGCQGGKVQVASAEIIFTEGLTENQVFRIGSQVCTLAQAKLILLNEKNQYEEAFGEELWKQQIEGETLEEYCKGAAKNQLAQLKVMVLLAEQEGILLTEEENAALLAAASEYEASLEEKEKEVLGITLEEIQEIYTDYYLADRVYEELTSKVSGEISDAEAKVIIVQHIFFGTLDKTEEQKKVLYDELTALKAEAEEGGSFSALAADYSEDTTIEYAFGRGEMEQSFETAAFALTAGEISDVVETSSGYHVIYCVSDYDVDKTTENKEIMLEKRKEAAFDKKYEKFVSGVTSEMNEKVWESISFEEFRSLSTDSLFEIYQKYMNS